jgi:hypothetical protein
VTRFERATGSLGSNNAGDLRTAEVGNSSTDTETDSNHNAAVCTSVCTSNVDTVDAGGLRELAEVIRGLSPGERETLRRLLDE